jgi:MoxR-like ATPase
MRPETQPATDERLAVAAAIAGRLLENIEQVLRGKRDEVRLVPAALGCHGHVLFEDVPGTGKTVLARAIAASVEDAVFARVQCTPDLQPSDMSGINIYNQRTRDFVFRRGPLFANVVLVDEINRAMPKTQSALLEAMAERQVTIDGQTYVLPQPFLVLATENPIEFEGVFPLPEAQLDRFFLKARLGYPGEEDELGVILDQQHGHPLDRVRPVVSVSDLECLEAALPLVYVDDLVRRWTIGLRRPRHLALDARLRVSDRTDAARPREAGLPRPGRKQPDASPLPERYARAGIRGARPGLGSPSGAIGARDRPARETRHDLRTTPARAVLRPCRRAPARSRPPPAKPLVLCLGSPLMLRRKMIFGTEH